MKNMMYKILRVVCALLVFFTASGFTMEDFELSDLKNYKREFKSQSVGACSTSSTKTYEDYRMITAVNSKQYQHIHNNMTVDETTGFLMDEDGFIGVAMGYLFGEIGTRYYVELDTGITIPVVKVDAKASVDAENGCSHNYDASVIEFVIDADIAFEYFGGVNGYVCNGNFNNYTYLNGRIQDIQLVLDEPIQEGVKYEKEMPKDMMKSTEQSDLIRFVQGGY